MALDSHYLNLSTALNAAWNSSGDGSLSAKDKTRVIQCLPTDDASDAPKQEAELHILQQVITACDLINSIGEGEIHWLSNGGQKFPRAVRRYFGLAASHFHNYDEELPEDFTNSLCEFIKKTQSHVATLNYDNLLYRPFVSQDICKGYNGSLVDGFHRSGFSESNLKRTYSNFGWYLHLHGSPLFKENSSGVIEKIQLSGLQSTHSERKHLILTHHDYKLEILKSSSILSAYWKYFRLAMKESKRLIIFGYSGTDTHVNRRIRLRLQRQKLRVEVIEWSGIGEHNSRMKYWKEALGKIDRLTHLDNILDYNFDSTPGH
ncbi:SIR2 family protein [Algisphaera agarilytica]|uniref:SIR2-like domain-containing protein n=1 Tax=Algisphaera agarilytica TaxID=1385975 RepID=A0A7X0LJN7_9BACT|nr:SIR2 family protein [Algisphaera agarilytica]MBB6429032.1 hypothetical protein [Algisphaera agarilytica]